jgi:hypothetical protein
MATQASAFELLFEGRVRSDERKLLTRDSLDHAHLLTLVLDPGKFPIAASRRIKHADHLTDDRHFITMKFLANISRPGMWNQHDLFARRNLNVNTR